MSRPFRNRNPASKIVGDGDEDIGDLIISTFTPAGNEGPDSEPLLHHPSLTKPPLMPWKHPLYILCSRIEIEAEGTDIATRKSITEFLHQS